MFPLLLLHHSDLLTDIFIYGAIAYILVMFILSRLRYRQIKKEKLRRKAERAAARQTKLAEDNPPPTEP
jgi:hypothetical protein